MHEKGVRELSRPQQKRNQAEIKQNFSKLLFERHQNKKMVVHDSVNLGSRWASLHNEKVAAPQHHPLLYQTIGKRAVGWKTNSLIKYDYSTPHTTSIQKTKQIDIFDYKA